MGSPKHASHAAPSQQPPSSAPRQSYSGQQQAPGYRPAGAAPGTPVDMPSKRKHTGRNVCIVLVVLALAAAAAFAGYKMWQGGQSSSTSASTTASTTTAASDTSEQAYYVLIVGEDSRTGTTEINEPNYADGKGRSDTMMLVRVDPVNYKITLVTIPRDTEATVDGTTNKINDAFYSGGIDACMDQVTSLTGVTPKYYLVTTFVNFENLVDQLGGVQANVPINMTLDDIVSGKEITLSPGPQKLNGASALVDARVRKAYANDLDACRQIQDRSLVQSLIQQVADNPSSAATAASTLSSNVQTNWPAADLVSEVKNFASNSSKITFYSGTGPYAGDIDDATGLWLVPRDETTWKKVIQVVDQGGDPTSVVALPTVAEATD